MVDMSTGSARADEINRTVASAAAEIDAFNVIASPLSRHLPAAFLPYRRVMRRASPLDLRATIQMGGTRDRSAPFLVAATVLDKGNTEMATRTRKTSGDSASIAAQLMLAPMVVWMRLPIMAMEPRTSTSAGIETMRAISEKSSAAANGVLAAQMSLFQSALQFWPQLVSGRTPSALGSMAAERALNAALKPAGRTVKANFRRLSTKR